MIGTGGISQQAALDGDLITPAVLRLLRDRGLRPSPQLPAARFALSSAAPLLVARPGHADAAVRTYARTWLAGRTGYHRASDPAEESLLHAFETSALVRPPAHRTAQRLDADLVEVYLWLCRHWCALSRATTDLRYVNAALKVLGVCLLAPVPPTELAAKALAEALESIDTHVRPQAGSTGADLPVLSPIPAAPTSPRARVAVLAGADSRGLPRFLASAQAARVPIVGVLHHEPTPSTIPEASSYTSAWYPQPDARNGNRAAPDPGPGSPVAGQHQVIGHRDWSTAATALGQWRCDLLVLVGMDVVPRTVLAVPRLGTVNAHNGALPHYRGMDAVAWAMLAGDPVACSVHEVTEQVDAGGVFAQRTVPSDTSDLRQAVKNTQINLLTEVCQAVTSTGTLPTTRPQTGHPRRFYRMHPALRRHLDSTIDAIGAAL
ncbi:formyltransferase family protein [Streptomyces sp. NRRL WC-3742]|uniref:formyltransferase family protein n=1 Tax=Streptomyces sp. NRRL WC-3742 TaxID=1463934 RepID=UPI0004C972BF|nr:formyltransferase family protein [Streptomyces sp. NRRL WC-3742]